MAKSSRTIFQFGALVMLLIVFPAVSWYYLNSGLQYRKAAMEELDDYGTFPNAPWTFADGSVISPSFLQGKMILAHVLPAAGQELDEQFGHTLQKLHHQFDERNELVFLSLVPGDSAQVAQRAEQFKTTYSLNDGAQIFFLQVGKDKLEDIRSRILQPREDIDQDVLFLLTDTSATIRRYYDVREESEIKRLVEHIALLLPLKKDRELIFKREAEK
ncbi:MAG: hypothetical protein R2824_32750 [Saprospiraceae bacterium]|nr:hypothetical protein [Lewinella sp.]